MTDLSFPVVPVLPPQAPPPVELVVRRRPLPAICESLAISLDDVVNDRRLARAVRDLYRVTRRIEDEASTRRLAEGRATEAWIAAHL